MAAATAARKMPATIGTRHRLFSPSPPLGAERVGVRWGKAAPRPVPPTSPSPPLARRVPSLSPRKRAERAMRATKLRLIWGLSGTDGQLADRGSPGGFGLVHVLGDERRVFEFAWRDGADDVGEGEVLGVVFEVERRNEAVV